MKQNLVSLEFSAAQLEAVDAALAALEKNLAELVTLTAEQRRKALKMGDGSEVFCRHGEALVQKGEQEGRWDDVARGVGWLRQALALHPMIGRKVASGKRELVIGRGSRGYVARYVYDMHDDVVAVTALRAQKEVGFEDG